MTRVLHISDIHVDVPLRQMPLGSFLGKRLMGGTNLTLRRGKHFRRVREKLLALDRFRRAQEIDLVICTGDYTVLGSDVELAAAREAIAPLTEAPLGFVTVPGNHDVYTTDALGRFERHFEGLLETDRDDLCTDGIWPLVRLFGEDLAVVGVNSARPNPHPWRSSGRVPVAQLDGLKKVLADEALADRFVFVITHYAPRRGDGRPDTWEHGLVNGNALLRVCRQLPRGAILHGHIHRRQHVRVPQVMPPLFGAGSTTQDRLEGLWVFDLDAGTATPGSFAGDAYVLDAPPVPLA